MFWLVVIMLCPSTFMFSVWIDKLLVVGNLLFRILLFISSLWSEYYRLQLLQPLTFLLLDHLLWLYCHLFLHHFICHVELLCLPVKLCSCKKFPFSGCADRFFFSLFAFQALCGEFWFIINLISKLIFFKWHFGAVFKSKDQKNPSLKNLSKLLQPISFYQDKTAKPKCISELHFPDTDTKWWG